MNLLTLKTTQIAIISPTVYSTAQSISVHAQHLDHLFNVVYEFKFIFVFKALLSKVS